MPVFFLTTVMAETSCYGYGSEGTDSVPQDEDEQASRQTKRARDKGKAKAINPRYGGVGDNGGWGSDRSSSCGGAHVPEMWLRRDKRRQDKTR